MTRQVCALALQEVVAGLSSPLFLAAPAGDARLFIVERPGRIRILRNGTLLVTPFLDVSSRVSTAGEGGLLSMAFDPQYASNGLFFVYLTDPSGDIAIERFRVSAGNPDVADPAPLRIIAIAHRSFSNHKGGLVAFGPDGFLYFGTGDGGGGGDPLGNAQNLNALLGKMLRLDVSNASAAQPYAIPPQNPFIGQAGRRGEIWAYGLRNPWRHAFDAATGLLYIADVGQDRIEEVNVAGVPSAGLNYGWNVTEGSQCYPGDPCNKQGITLPALEYAHDASGGCSISGGRVFAAARSRNCAAGISIPTTATAGCGVSCTRAARRPIASTGASPAWGRCSPWRRCAGGVVRPGCERAGLPDRSPVGSAQCAKEGTEMRMFRLSLLVAGLLLGAANVPGIAQEFKPYAGARLDEKASREASAASPGKQSEVYTTTDAFDKVLAFYKGQYKEVPMSRPPPKIAGQQIRWAFFILDDGTSLATARISR